VRMVSDEELDDLESFGVKKLEDFTWKHILDFYSCADCGRCSDKCPANAVKRPLSPGLFPSRAGIKCLRTIRLTRVILKSREPLIGEYL
jgi:ferredoxin